MHRTKIVATLGPSSESKTKILELVRAGMDIARLNFSHGNEEQFRKIVTHVRAASKDVKILQDLQGPKIRLGEVAEGSKLSKGESVIFSTEPEEDTLHLPYAPLPDIVKPGDRILINDGIIQCEVTKVEKKRVHAKVIAGGDLISRKGVNLPDSELPTRAKLSAKDHRDLEFGVKELKVDAVALSFVEDADDIRHLRKAIEKLTDREVQIIAKIERPQALENIHEILREADGIMVARGDLGIETPLERVPLEQKHLIQLARKADKPVIVATQILQSMVKNPVATRAEISDAANVIFDHADAFMLSNETAVGKYPVEAVKTLAKVAEATEGELFEFHELP